MHSTDSMQSLSNYQWLFSQNQNKKFHNSLETQKTLSSQSNLEKEDQTGGINLPDFTLYYKATVIKTVWYWQKDRPMEKDREPRDEPTHLWVPQNIQQGRDSLFNKCWWENLTAMYKRMKLDHYLMPYTEINSKQIKDLNVRPESIKLLEENIHRTFDHINQSKIFYDPPSRVMEIKTKVNKWDVIKLKTFSPCLQFPLL